MFIIYAIIVLLIIYMVWRSLPKKENYGFSEPAPTQATSTTQLAPRDVFKSKITYQFSAGTPDKKPKPALGA